MKARSVLLAGVLCVTFGCGKCALAAVGFGGNSPGAGGDEPLPEHNIAQMAIVTENAAPVASRDVYVNGHLSIVDNGSAAGNALEADMKVKGRGNYTWTLDKKPYKITLNTASSVMGFPPDTEWVLLANHVDKSLVRTSLAFEVSRRMGLAYTPRSAYVDLSVNGRARGSYLLTEQVKGGPGRVSITSMKPTDISGAKLTGGYLVELNARLDENVNWRTTRNTPYSLKEPSDAAPEQVAYIRDYVQTAEDALYSENFADPMEGYAKYIDVESFIQLYFVHELLKNKDAADFGSIYFYKERNHKLKMGPAWDFDLAAGNSDVAEVNDPRGWLLKTRSPWYKRLFDDPAFVAKVKQTWSRMKVQLVDTLALYIDAMADRLNLSQKKNFEIWHILTLQAFPVLTPKGTFQGEVDFLKAWLKTRTDWMDQEINSR